MYEFHGWAVLRYHTHDTNEQLQEEALLQFEQYIEETDRMNLSIIKRYNGQDSFLITGLHNHYAAYVLEIFEWIATYLPGAYGLLYVHDDEAGDDINENQFVVWKLARGKLEKAKDPFLSPYIPVVEDSYDPSRDD